MRKVVVLAAAVVAALGVTASSATSAASETGVTARTIVIGGTFPLTGPASLTRRSPPSMKAYFSYINSRKGPGRQARHLRPPDRLQHLRRRLQPGQHRAADAQARRAGQGLRRRRLSRYRANEAIRPYLNAQKVPQILNATGASTWGKDAKQYPWTGGWQPDYEFEARIYGQRSPATARTRRSQCSTRTTASGRTTCAVSRRGSVRRRRTSSARSRTR